MSDLILTIKAKQDDIIVGDLLIQIAQGKSVDFSDYDVGLVHSVVHSFKNEILDYIAEHGLTSLIVSQPLLEHIVVQGATPSQIIPVFQKYLDKMVIDNELIILDPFFYATPKDPNYTTTVSILLDKYIPTIDDLHIITSNHNINTTIKTTIETDIKAKKPTINIHHKRTNDYHDRYWISNSRDKGVVTGTSLNGLGNKAALIDRLNTTDVRTIIASLTADGLL